MRAAILLAICMVSVPSAFAAEGLNCNNFLHERGGTWRTFEKVDVFGPDGVVHLKAGERLSPTDGSSKGDIARALNEICTK